MGRLHRGSLCQRAQTRSLRDVSLQSRAAESPFEVGLYPNWGVHKPKENENIWDWARETMREFLDGDWKEQERKRLFRENETLKAALKASRQRSASRLVRLNKVAAKKPPKPAAPPLRLVAAE